MAAEHYAETIGLRLVEGVDALSQERLAAQDTNNPFEIEPLPLEDFLYDEGYLGLPPLSPIQLDFLRHVERIYPQWLMDELGWPRLPQIAEAVVVWGKGSGKDTMSAVAQARIIYLLLCLRNPLQFYHLTHAGKIDLVNMAYNAQQALNNFFTPFKSLIAASAWFRPRVEEHTNYLEFDFNIKAHSGHSDQESMEGYSPILVVLDEIAAFKSKKEMQQRSPRAGKHSADAVYDAMKSSVTSRFPNAIGKLVLISYPRYLGDFILTRYAETEGDPLVWRSLAATWEVNPTKKRSDFDEEFRRDPERARGKYACQPGAWEDSFFRRRHAVLQTFHAVQDATAILPTTPEAVATNPVTEEGEFLPSLRPIPDTDYYIHIDIGVSSDAAGMDMVHLARTIKYRGGDGDYEVPVVKQDFSLGLKATPGSEVQIAELRRRIRDLRERGFRIRWVGFDQYQSTDSQQILEAEGFHTGQISVDRTDKPYTDLKALIYDGRFEGVYDPVLVTELLNLIRVAGNKVDHPVGGSKDRADGLAGATEALLLDFVGELLPEEQELPVLDLETTGLY